LPHFKSKYADLAACIEAVIDALNNNGIALVQQSHHCEDGVIIETLFIHESGETISGGKLQLRAMKQDPHGFMYGSAMTYARRYAHGPPAASPQRMMTATVRYRRQKPQKRKAF
jgi:hypothetical protein